MTFAEFPSPREFFDQASLDAAFGSANISLAPGGTVIFDGAVSIEPGVTLAGRNKVGAGCHIGRGSVLTDVFLGARNHVRHYSILEDVVAGNDNLLGPFCFIRSGCRIGDDCILGAHVEAARSSFGNGSRVSHRAFIGDAQLGQHTIVGAGVVFCNYSEGRRWESEIGAGVTLGSGVLVVAPLHVGDGAVVGAGSILTKDVPPGAKVIQKR